MRNSVWINVSCDKISHPLIYRFTNENMQIEFFTDSVIKFEYKVKKNKLFLKNDIEKKEFDFKIVDNSLILFGADTVYFTNSYEFLNINNKLQEPILYGDDYYWKLNDNFFRSGLITNIHFFTNNKHILEIKDDNMHLYDYQLGSYNLLKKEINGENLYFLWFTIVSVKGDFIYLLTETDENNIKGVLLGNKNLSDSIHLEKKPNKKSELFLNGKWNYYSHYQSYPSSIDLVYFEIPVSLMFWTNILEFEDDDFSWRSIDKMRGFEYKDYDKLFFRTKYYNDDILFNSFFSERIILLNPYFPEYYNDIIQIVLNDGKDLGIRFYFNTRNDDSHSSVEVYYERDLKFEE